MRLTIERIRTLVLGAGVLVVVALVAFLAFARWKNHFSLREIPKHLGANIQQEANGVTYTQAHGGHTLFKIHASKVVQLKQGGRAILHDVQIELYGEDGARIDRIAGDEFEYDQKNGIAKAEGPVEITLMRPTEAPAVAPKATPAHPPKNTPLENAAQKASLSEIHVKTSGLVFDQKSGVATTAERVEFAMTQGKGSSEGATFDSEKGQLVLERAVELDVRQGPERVVLHAQHAEFERDNMLCRMQGAQGTFRGGQATAGQADLLFRPDGSAVRLDAANGFSLVSASSARVAAPRGTLEFDEHNQPRHGSLEGGATMDSSSDGRQVHGSAPTADLAFTPQGVLSHAHLERGVAIHSDETNTAQDGKTQKVSRDWKSSLADVTFRSAQRTASHERAVSPQRTASPRTGNPQVELVSVTGSGGVVITGQTQRGNGPVIPSRMSADQVMATFADGQVLTTVLGTGHAALEQTSNSGAKQITSGDRIEATFAPASGRSAPKAMGQDGPPSAAGAEIQSATVDGHVVLVQQPAARRDPASKPGVPAEAPLRATAGRAVYEGAGEWLHLTIEPRVENGGLQLTANRLDISQASGDAFARGNVKATWAGNPGGKPTREENSTAGAESGAMALGGQGPAHVVAAEAQLHPATGEATFRGHARLWQQSNSISAPVIVLNRLRQTLVAHSSSAADPVRVTMLSADRNQKTGNREKGLGNRDRGTGIREQGTGPSVIRVRGGDLKYSEAERKAVMHADPGGSVVAETGSATVAATDLELVLLAPGNHAGPEGEPAQVDQVTASGHVRVNAQGRRGAGERLVYSSETGEYVLTGTAANPPTLTDPAKGTVSGASLIFNSRDDSVSIEGGGRKTLTETVAPK